MDMIANLWSNALLKKEPIFNNIIDRHLGLYSRLEIKNKMDIGLLHVWIMAIFGDITIVQIILFQCKQITQWISQLGNGYKKLQEVHITWTLANGLSIDHVPVSLQI